MARFRKRHYGRLGTFTRCFKKWFYDGWQPKGRIFEDPLPLRLAAAIALLLGARRVARIREDGYVEFYGLQPAHGGRLCLRLIGIGEERHIGEGDVVAVDGWIDPEYAYELFERGVVAIVKPPSRDPFSDDT